MDNLTHTLVGVTLANAGLKQRLGRGTTVILAVASNIPDLNVFGGFFFGSEMFLYRRMLTHSVLGLPLLSLACATIFRPIFKNLPLKTIFGLCLLGMSLHAFFDLVNSFGVVLLYPFSRTRFELAWIFIIDLFIWGLLLLPLVISIFRKAGHMERSRWAAGALAAYLALAGAGHIRSEILARRWITGQGVEPQSVAIFPEALGAHRFRAAIRVGDDYRLAMIRPWTGRVDAIGVQPTMARSAEALVARAHPMGRKLEWFFKAPVWLSAGDGLWKAFDLRFRSAVIPRGNPFVYWFMVSSGEAAYMGRRSTPPETQAG